MATKNPPRPYFPEDVNDLPETDYLIDLFEFFDGTRVETIADWLRRRDELRDLMQYYLYGCKRETPENASHLRMLTEEESDALTPPPMFPGFPPMRPVAAVQIAQNGQIAQILLDGLRVPQKGIDTEFDAPYPAVIAVGMLPNEQVDALAANGYAYVAMNTASVYSDGGNNPRTGAYCELYPYEEGDYACDSGVLMGWAWGISRLIDALKNAPELGIAWDKCAVTGCSRNGKAAAIAGAFDDRIAVTAPSDPGGGGLTGFRYSTEGMLHAYGVPDGNDSIYSRNESAQRAIGNPSESAWFCSNAQMFLHGNALRAPFDLHAVAALVAPRPFICWTGEAQQSWLNSPSTALNVLAAQEVYAFLGSDNTAVVVRDGPHANQGRDLPDLIAIMDRTFGRSGTLNIRKFVEITKDDGSAYDNSGAFRPTGEYVNIASLSRVPYDLENSFVRWARPGKYALWSRDKFLADGISRTVSLHTDAPFVQIDGERIEVRDGIVNYTFVSPKTGRTTVTATGGDKVVNSITLTCLSMENALRYGLNLTGGSPDGMAIGFTSPITGTPEAFVDGKRLTMCQYDDGSAETYLERYGISLKPKGFPDAERFTFTVRGFGLEALPGYEFDISVELYKTKVRNWFGQEVDAITADIGEKPQIMTMEQYISV